MIDDANPLMSPKRLWQKLRRYALYTFFAAVIFGTIKIATSGNKSADAPVTVTAHHAKRGCSFGKCVLSNDIFGCTEAVHALTGRLLAEHDEDGFRRERVRAEHRGECRWSRKGETIYVHDRPVFGDPKYHTADSVTTLLTSYGDILRQSEPQ